MKKPNKEAKIEGSNFRGVPIMALYRQVELPMHEENPLIESLPPIFDEQRAAEKLRRLVKFSASTREASAATRKVALKAVRQFVWPTNEGIHLFLTVDRMIRNGLVGRNPYQNGRIVLATANQENPTAYPVLEGGWEELDERLAEQDAKMGALAMVENNAVIAPSGSGKTTIIQKILLNYPQVIQHTQYRGQEFLFQHIVWLYTEMPHNGSPIALMQKILEEIDDLLKTNFRTSHTGSVNKMTTHLERVNGNLRIGLLVVDEAHRLAIARGKTQQEMMEFLVQLSNTVKIPILLLGTHQAKEPIEGAMQNLRRFSSAGDYEWALPQEFEAGTEDVKEKDKRSLSVEWESFMTALFQYQYLRKPVSFDRAFSHAFFDNTAGIKDLVVKLFVLSQERAMDNARSPEDECLTPQLVRQVADDELAKFQPVVRALLHRDFNVLKEYEDLAGINLSATAVTSPQVPALKNQNEANANDSAETPSPETGQAALSANGNSQPVGQNAARTKNPPKPEITDPTDIRFDADHTNGTDQTTLESLRSRGFLSDSSQFIP